jgi:putative sigma-54 modulation protein
VNLRIAAKHLDLEKAGLDFERDVKPHAEKRIVPLKRFFDNVIDADLVLISEKHRQIAELTFKVPGPPLTAKVESKAILESIDLVTEKIERQLRKYKDVLKAHKGSDLAAKEKLNEGEIY